jgi:hypothetical protein
MGSIPAITEIHGNNARKLCEVVDQMLTVRMTRPASQRVGLSEVPGNQGIWPG